MRAQENTLHIHVLTDFSFPHGKPKWNFLPSRACGPLATTMRFGINKQFGFSTGRSRSRPSVPQNRLLSLFLTLWKHTLSGLRNALIPSNSVGHEQFEDLGLSGFSAAGGPKIMSFDDKGDQGAGFEVSNLERKTVVSHHPSGNIREGSRCPSLLSATTSAASFNDLSSLFKEDLRKGGKNQCLFELPLRSSTSLQARRDQYRDRLPNPSKSNEQITHNVQRVKKRNKSSQAMKKVGTSCENESCLRTQAYVVGQPTLHKPRNFSTLEYAG